MGMQHCNAVIKLCNTTLHLDSAQQLVCMAGINVDVLLTTITDMPIADAAGRAHVTMHRAAGGQGARSFVLRSSVWQHGRT